MLEAESFFVAFVVKRNLQDGNVSLHYPTMISCLIVAFLWPIEALWFCSSLSEVLKDYSFDLIENESLVRRIFR